MNLGLGTHNQTKRSWWKELAAFPCPESSIQGGQILCPSLSKHLKNRCNHLAVSELAPSYPRLPKFYLDAFDLSCSQVTPVQIQNLGQECSSFSFPFYIKIRKKITYFHDSLYLSELNKIHSTLLMVFSSLFQTRMTPPKLKRCEMNREENRGSCSTKNVSLIFIFFFAGCFLYVFVLWCLEVASIRGVHGVLVMPLPLALGISYLCLKLLRRPQKSLTSTLGPSGFVALRLNAYSWQSIFVWAAFQSSAGMMKCIKRGFWAFSLV